MCTGAGPFTEVWPTYQGHIFKENWLSPPRSHQLLVSLQLPGSFPGLILYRSCTSSHSRCGLRSGKHRLVAVLCTHWLWRHFCTFSYDIPWVLATENMTYMAHLKLSTTHPLILYMFWVSVLTTITVTEAPLMMAESRITYQCKDKYLEGSLVLCLFILCE